MMRRLIFVFVAMLCATSATAQAPLPVNTAAINAERPPELLSAYRFFRDAGAREPNARVTPYDLNTALYSDGALKFRYVFIPEGQRAAYNDTSVFEFPVGTVLIKTFALAVDMRHPTENVRFLETRLLIRRAEGWVALPYVWNEAQTEARYTPIGADIPVSFTSEAGDPVAFDWAVPNRNQCKGCHDHNGDLTPIGPSARNLNRMLDYPDRVLGVAAESPAGGRDNNPIIMEGGAAPQLATWRQRGLIERLPESDIPNVPSAFDESAPLDLRARAYLDVNCAHCHNPSGPAHTSGLDLSWSQSDPSRWGVGKRPVAAGRASAGFDFAIDPGHAERSILLYRMESTDPGVMMPELGRQRVDARGVALIREWINSMDEHGNTRD